MRCPKCNENVELIEAGKRGLDSVLACVACSWQVAKRDLKTWLDKWKVD